MSIATITLTLDEVDTVREALMALINRYTELAEDCYKEGKEEIAVLFENDYHKAVDIIKKFHVEQKEAQMKHHYKTYITVETSSGQHIYHFNNIVDNIFIGDEMIINGEICKVIEKENR